jgi:plasmid replication initiation protein
MRGRPKKEVAVIHNELARAHTDLSSLGLRLMAMLAVRATHDGDLLTHKLKVKEYKSRLGLTGRSAYATLEQTADEMLKSLVEIGNPVEGSRTKFQILSHAKYYDNQGIIELRFHDHMRPLLLELKKHFTQVPLDVFLRLRSAYAMKMYLHVRSWNPLDSRNHLPNWEMSVEHVRWFFGLDPNQYKEPKHIAAAVLKRAMRELNERAEVTFRFESIKGGRKLLGWSFRAIPNTPTITLPAGAAAAKRRLEQKEEDESAKASRMSGSKIENAKESWLNATQEARDRWLRQIPELVRPREPDAPGVMFLSVLSEIISGEQEPQLPGFCVA